MQQGNTFPRRPTFWRSVSCKSINADLVKTDTGHKVASCCTFKPAANSTESVVTILRVYISMERRLGHGGLFRRARVIMCLLSVFDMFQ